MHGRVRHDVWQVSCMATTVQVKKDEKKGKEFEKNRKNIKSSCDRKVANGHASGMLLGPRACKTEVGNARKNGPKPVKNSENRVLSIESDERAKSAKSCKNGWCSMNCC
jgi:hypothetical protein